MHRKFCVEQKWVALDMVLHVQDDHPEKWLKNGSFSIDLWKNNGPSCRCLLDAPAIVLIFQDDRPENSPKTAIFGL